MSPEFFLSLKAVQACHLSTFVILGDRHAKYVDISEFLHFQYLI